MEVEEGSKAHPDQAQGPALIPAELDAFSTIFWAKVFGLLNYWELEKFASKIPGTDIDGERKYRQAENSVRRYTPLCAGHPPTTRKGKMEHALLRIAKADLVALAPWENQVK